LCFLGEDFDPEDLVSSIRLAHLPRTLKLFSDQQPLTPHLAVLGIHHHALVLIISASSSVLFAFFGATSQFLAFSYMRQCCFAREAA